ncbi:MAG: hypothetical protein RL141_461 [Candidatus Parcubacteria bacterium]|jgi:presenilin-like A22 family membrane protease
MADIAPSSRVRLPIVPVGFVAGCYAILCGLVIGGVWVADGRVDPGVPLRAALQPWQALVFLAAGILVAALLIRKVRARMAWELLLGITLFLGVWFYFWVIVGGDIGLLLAAAGTFLQAWVRRVGVHNLFILCGAAGVALNFAYLLPVHIPLILLVGFAAYDTFVGRAGAVGAEVVASLVHRGMVPGIVIPGRFGGLWALLRDEIRQPAARFLGVGDLVLPSVAVARAAVFGFAPAVAVAVGTVVGAVWLAQHRPEDPRPFPALVPLAIGAGIPYAFVLFFFRV